MVTPSVAHTVTCTATIPGAPARGAILDAGPRSPGLGGPGARGGGVNGGADRACTFEHSGLGGPSSSPSSPHLPSCTTLSPLDSSPPHREGSGPLRWCPLAPLRWPRPGRLAGGLGAPHSLCIQLSCPQVVEGVGEGLGPLVLVGQHITETTGPSLTLACASLPRPGRTRGGEVLSGTLQGAGRVRPSPGAPSFPARVPEPVPSARTGDVSMERALSGP